MTQENYTIQWHKLDAAAKIPSKRPEDAGFDIYTTESYYVLMPREKHLFKTDLQYSIDEDHWLMAFDRGSTGSRGIHTHCGICDQGYRGEVFICLCNDNEYPIIFSNQVDSIYKEDYAAYFDHEENQHIGKVLYYPVSKAIAQLIPMRLEKGESAEVSDEEWELLKNNSERGETKLGESGK